jgi:hypothetical protein
MGKRFYLGHTDDGKWFCVGRSEGACSKYQRWMGRFQR